MARYDASHPVNAKTRASLRQGHDEGGYALVALLALMTILALLMISAAPSISQQAMREREKEAIFRGEEIAEAMSLYVRTYNRLPNSMDDLLKGLPRGGSKNLQILRHSATIDPLSSSGEWKLLRPNDAKFVEFQRQVMLYSNGLMPPTRERFLQQYLVRIAGVVDTKSEEDAPGGEDDSENSSGPFLGVTSRSRRDSVLTYYGIDRHDKWIFTPLFRG